MTIPGAARCRAVLRVPGAAALLAAAFVVPAAAIGQEADGDAPPEPRLPRVAVMRFAVPVADEWWVTTGDAASRDLFSERLRETGLFEVLDREELDRIAIEERLRDQGELTPAAAVKASRILDVDYVLGGELFEYRPVLPGLLKRGVGKLPGLGTDQHHFVTDFGARMWDARAGRLVWADRVRSEFPTSRARALELQAGEAAPAVLYGDWLEPLLAGLAQELVADLGRAVSAP